MLGCKADTELKICHAPSSSVEDFTVSDNDGRRSRTVCRIRLFHMRGVAPVVAASTGHARDTDATMIAAMLAMHPFRRQIGESGWDMVP